MLKTAVYLLCIFVYLVKNGAFLYQLANMLCTYMFYLQRCNMFEKICGEKNQLSLQDIDVLSIVLPLSFISSVCLKLAFHP